MEFYEKINITKAEKLLCNWDSLNKEFENDEYFNSDNQKNLLKKIIIKVQNECPTTYKHGKDNNFGRLYANNSLQQMKRSIRNTITEDYYDDIDMSRSAPTILLWKAKQYKIKLYNLNEHVTTNKYKHLKEYINKILFGSKVEKNLPDIDEKFLDDLKHEMFKLYDKLYEDTEYSSILKNIKENNDYNIKGKLCAKVYQIIESEILEQSFKYLNGKNINISNSVKMYDGFLINKNSNIDLNDLNCNINQEMGIPVKFIKKNFDEIINTKNMSNKNIDMMYDGDDNYQKQKIKFEKHMSMITSDSIFISRDCENKFDFFSKTNLITSFEHIQYLNKIIKNEKITWKNENFLKRWLADEDKKIFKRMGVYPPPKKIPENHLNLWTKWEAEYIKLNKYDEDAVEKFKNHIKILCNHDNEMYLFILKYFAQMLQYPSIKTFIPIFISNEGAGKGTLIEIIRKIMGNLKVMETTKPSQYIFGNFNSMMCDAFLVVLNEVEKKEFSGFLGQLKGLVTDPKLIINKKGVGHFEIESFHRFIGATNVDDPIPVSPQTRRIIIIRCSDELCDKIINNEYHLDMRKIINDENAIKSIYNYLMSIPNLENFHTEKLPVSEYQLQILQKNLVIEKQFMIWFVSKSINIKSNETALRLKSETLMKEFKIFVKKMNYTRLDNMAISTLCLKLHNLKLAGFSKQEAHTFNYSVFNLPVLREELKIDNNLFIDDDEDEFDDSEI